MRSIFHVVLLVAMSMHCMSLFLRAFRPLRVVCGESRLVTFMYTH